MELVLLIALGIVLGVVLLAFLPLLLNVLAVVFVIGLAIAAIALVTAFPDRALTLVGIAAGVGLMAVASVVLFGDGGLAHRFGNRRYASDYFSLFEYQIQELKNGAWTTVDGSPARTVAVYRAKNSITILKSESQNSAEITTAVRVIRKTSSSETELVRWDI